MENNIHWMRWGEIESNMTSSFPGKQGSLTREREDEIAIQFDFIMRAQRSWL